MKLNSLYALAIAGALTTFASCSDKDDPVAPGGSLPQKTYTAQDGLMLSLNGAPLIGKTVTFTPGAGGNATLTLAGEPLDMSAIMDAIMGGVEDSETEDAGGTKADTQPVFTIPTAGILPGSVSVSLPVTLEGEGDNCTFSGNSESDFCTFSYTGKITPDSLFFNLKDVKLKNASLAGKWTLPDLYQPDSWDPEQSTPNMNNILRFNWEAEKKVEIMPGWGMPIETIAGMTLVMPMIQQGETKVSAVEMLAASLKSVTFGEDGNVTAEYIDAKTQAQTTAPVGVAQYIVASDNMLLLYLNPTAIIATTQKLVRTRALPMDPTVIMGLLEKVIPMLSQGIPVSYGKAVVKNEAENITENTYSFYLDKTTLLPILKQVAPLCKNQDFVDAIVAEASKDPEMGSMAVMLPMILDALPEIIDTTSVLEIGINLDR